MAFEILKQAKTLKLAQHDLGVFALASVVPPPENWNRFKFLLGHVSVQTTERYLGCTQRISFAVNDRIGIEPNS